MRRWIVGMWGIAIAGMLLASPVAAEETEKPNDTVAAAATESAPVETNLVAPVLLPRTQGQAVEVASYRPRDIQGLNVFEPAKTNNEKFNGKQIIWGFGFAQQFQGLHHQNSALPKMTTVSGVTVNSNQLMEIGYGFNNASANLYLDAQLARGIRVALTSYLSSRHHQEAWVKDGFLLIDASPIDQELLNRIMEKVTLRVGHFEINYGDAHFRRSDNGNAFYNPFVGNLLMDAFTTEIGAEAYVRSNGLLAMAGVTGGEVKGQVQKPQERSPSYLAKLGYDHEFAPRTRVRLTGSFYTNKKSVSNTLYSGSRAGSRYYSVVENAQSTETAQAWSGDVQPGFKNKVTAFVVNPFVKVQGFEFFGNLEQASGKATAEKVHRVWTQYAGEGLYRFLGDQLYVGGRYNLAKGALAGMTGDVKVERIQTGGGWFVTSNVLAKAEFVRENYMKFPANDIRSGANFNGFMIEGVVTF